MRGSKSFGKSWHEEDLGGAYEVALASRPGRIPGQAWEDAVGDAVLRLLGRADTHAPIADLVAYLIRVAQNCHRRASSGTKPGRLELEAGAERSTPKFDPWLTLRYRRLLLRLLESPIAWTGMQAKFLEARFHGGHATPSSMAATLGCTRQYVERLAAAIVQKAKRHFAEKTLERRARRRKPRP